MKLLQRFDQLNEKEAFFFKELKTFITKLNQAKKDYRQDQLISRFIKLLEKYTKQYQAFLKNAPGCYNVSSDVIESLFGIYKNLAGTNKLVGVSLLDLQLAVHCKTEKEILTQTKTALESVFTTHLLQWRVNHSSENQSLKRKRCTFSIRFLTRIHNQIFTQRHDDTTDLISKVSFFSVFLWRRRGVV